MESSLIGIIATVAWLSCCVVIIYLYVNRYHRPLRDRDNDFIERAVATFQVDANVEVGMIYTQEFIEVEAHRNNITIPIFVKLDICEGNYNVNELDLKVAMATPVILRQ